MNDKILITKDALNETIRCAICQNSNKTERGCDGSCQYDKELHAKIVEAVEGIAEERPHGEWLTEPHSRIMHCSNCNAEENINKLYSAKWCYSCGADMRKESDPK